LLTVTEELEEAALTPEYLTKLATDAISRSGP
jgi:hypothetical protein